MSLPKNIRFGTPRTNPKSYNERFSELLDKEDASELADITVPTANSRPDQIEKETAQKYMDENTKI